VRCGCPTCAGTRIDQIHFDPSAPFFQLVVEIDRITLAEQRAAFARTKEANQ
jgi:hypothetical protein